MRMQVQYVNDMERPGYTVEHGKTPDSIAKSVFGEEAESRNVTDPRFGGPYVFIVNGVILAHAKITFDEDRTPEPKDLQSAGGKATKQDKGKAEPVQEDGGEGWNSHTVNAPYEALDQSPSVQLVDLEERPEEQEDEDQDCPEDPDKASEPVPELEPLKVAKAAKPAVTGKR